MKAGGTGIMDEQTAKPADESQRLGWVDLEKVALPATPQLAESDAYRQMRDKLDSSEAVVREHEARGAIHLEAQLTAILDALVTSGGMDALMIGSDDGLLVAQSSSASKGEILAAISSLFEQTVSRAQREGLVSRVEEMTLRGFAGEQLIVRYFPGLPRFFLIAYAARKCTYRRTTNLALRRCGDLLERMFGEKEERHAPESPPVQAQGGQTGSATGPED